MVMKLTRVPLAFLSTLSTLSTLSMLVGLGACTAAPPAMPTFAKDVGPIFMAHCSRCHSSSGLVGDPAMFPLGGRPKGYNTATPSYCHLDRYDDAGTDCVTTQTPPGCSMGAHTCVMFFKPTLLTYIKNDIMPPPPAPKLDDWELEVVESWLNNPLP